MSDEAAGSFLIDAPSAETFICTEAGCGREFKTRSALLSHVKTHEGTHASNGAAPKGGVRERLWGKREPKTERTPKAPAKAKGRRRDSDATIDFLGEAWGWLGRQVEAHYALPTGRALQLEAGIAGVVLDEAIAGKAADRPVQWMVRQQTSVAKVFDLFGFPFMVEVVRRNPASLPVMAPRIVDALVRLGPSLEKATRRMERRRADTEKALAALGPLLGFEGDNMTVDDVIAWLFPVPADA